MQQGNQNGTVFELEFTVPFGCIHVYSESDLYDCIISIEMDYNNHTEQCGPTVGVLGLGSQLCSHRVEGYTRTKHLNGEKWTSTFSWNVSNAGGSLEHSNAYKLRLKALTSSSLYTFWNNYQIGDIDVSKWNKVFYCKMLLFVIVYVISCVCQRQCVSVNGVFPANIFMFFSSFRNAVILFFILCLTWVYILQMASLVCSN